MKSSAAKIVPPSAIQLDETHDPADATEAEFEKILYHITHDLRASLRAVRIIPEWVLEDLDKAKSVYPASVEENLDLLRLQAGLADQLLVDLLTYSRIGRRSDPPRWNDLAPAIDAALEQAKMPEEFRVFRCLEADAVFLPANDLSTLLKEVLHNAWWHHGAQEGAIRIESSGTEDNVRIRIIDDGAGIAPEHSERVFEMMTTLQPRDVRPGSGLGLASARKIVTQAGGEIRSIPTHGGGTIIETVLPIPAPSAAQT